MLPPIEGPLLDVLNLARDAIARVWWSGFWWGALAGFVAGQVFAAITRDRK